MQQTNNPTRSFAGNSLFIFLAKFFPALAFSIVWVYASKNIDTENYGLFQKFWTQLFVLAAIGTIGFPVFILTYAPTKAIAIIQSLKRKPIGFYLAFLAIIAFGFAAIQHQNQNNAFLQSFLLLIVFIGIIIADSLLIVFKAFKPIIGINLVYSIIFCTIHIVNIKNGFNLQQLILLIALLSFLRLLAALYYIIPAFRQHQDKTLDLHKEEESKIKSLWLQLGINEVITQLFRWVDKFVLSFIISRELFAIYFNGSTEFQFLAILFSAVSSAAVQHWAYHHNTKNNSTGKIPLLHYSARILSSIMFPLFFFFMFYRAAFLTVVFSPSYIAAVWIFVCSQLVLPLRAYPFTALLQSEHRGDIINKGAIIDFILAVALMYPLYLLMGLPGVALSFVISTYWQAGYYLWHTSTLLNVAIAELVPFKVLLRKFLTFGIILGLSYWAAQYLFESTIAIFVCGVSVLLALSISSLWQEWKMNKKTNEFL